MDAYKDEPLYVVAAVLKCAVCLMMIVGLAVIGVVESTRDPRLHAASDGAAQSGNASRDTREARVSSERPDAPTRISNTIDALPVVYEKACAKTC